MYLMIIQRRPEENRRRRWKKLYSKPEIYVIEINFFAVLRLEQQKLNEQNENYKAKKRTLYTLTCVRKKTNKHSIYYTIVKNWTETALASIQYVYTHAQTHYSYSASVVIKKKNWIHCMSACMCMRMTLFSMIFFFPFLFFKDIAFFFSLGLLLLLLWLMPKAS